MIKDVSKQRELLFRDFLENNSNNQKKLIQYIFERYKNFEIKLYTIFRDLNEKRTAEYKLAKLRQTGSIFVYIV